MHYTVNRGEKGKVEIKVNVPKADFNKAYDEILAELGKSAKVAGFRPGNVPKNILEANLGANKILNETASSLISKHLTDIFKKENIVPINSPAIAVESLVWDSPFSFVATLTAKPFMKLGNWEQIRVKKIKAKEVTERDIEESIKNIYEAWLKQSFAAKASKDRQESGSDDAKSGLSNAAASENSKKFIYDARGNKVFFDEKKTLRSSSSQDSTAGLKIDDNFAKAIGAGDLVHLRESVKRDLEQIVADQVEAKAEEEIFEELLKICEVDVADILIDDELNRILVRLNSQLEQQNKKLDDYLREQNTTVDALRAKWRGQAEKNVKVTLIMSEIGQKKGIKVEKDEIEQALKSMDEGNLTSDQKRNLENYISVSIFQAKTLDLVKKTVVI